MDTSATGWSRRTLCILGLVGAAVVAVDALFLAVATEARPTIWFDDLAEFGAAALAAVACARAARRRARRGRLAWWLLAASAGSWAIGQGAWSVDELLFGELLPFPSVADVFFLLAVPLGVAALFAFPSAPTRATGRMRALLDAVAASSGVLFVGWALVLGPLYRASHGWTLAEVLQLAYPIGDVATISVAVVAASRARSSVARGPLIDVVAGLVAVAVADAAFAVLNASGDFGAGAVWNVGWVAGWLLVGRAAMRTRRAVVARHDDDEVPSRVAVVLPYAFVVPVMVIGATRIVTGARVDAVLATTGVLLGLCVVTRQMLLLLDNLRLTYRLEGQVADRTAELAAREARFAAMVAEAHDGVVLLAADGTVMWRSSSVRALLGDHDVPIGSRLTFAIDPRDGDDWRAALASAVARPSTVVTTMWRAAASGRSFEARITSLLHDVAVNGVVVNLRDVTERLALEEQLRYQALHDALTGLANRTLFRDRVEHQLAGAGGRGAPIALLYVDIDDFKAVNDGHGHPVGDAVLCGVAERLRAMTRATDTVARLGGDEFAILLTDCGAADALAAAELVLREFEDALYVDGVIVKVSACVGVATFEEGCTAEDLFRRADVALYAAKWAGKARVEVFSHSVHAGALERLRLTGELQHAIEAGELRVHYQPIVHLATRQIVGVEALVRWQHPANGLLPPAQFIDLAESTGLVVPMGAWVLHQACRDAVAMDAANRPKLDVTVNVSPAQLRDPAIVSTVQSALDASRLRPGRLTLELTETMLMDDIEGALPVLTALKALGVRLAIDDFGTGYSSLAYLRRLPVDTLKIDRAFLAEIDSGADATLVRTIVSLARDLDLSTVVEGVERADQVAPLVRLGCNRAQGYLFARPMPLDDLLRTLTTGIQPSAAPTPAPKVLLAQSGLAGY